MPYSYKPAEKTTSLAVLAQCRDLSERGYYVTVFDISDFLKDVQYETMNHRRNDASQRLRTLTKSGYIRKVTPQPDDPQAPKLTVAAAPQFKGSKAIRRIGRPPAVYVLTEPGLRYSRTIADDYVDESGKSVPRGSIVPFLEKSLLLIANSGQRVIVKTEKEDQAISIVKKWADRQGLKIGPFEVSGPVVIGKETEGSDDKS